MTSNKEKGVPWVEKYRPTRFNDLVLTPENERILKNIIKDDYFPNMLFYGPPGTGKTTTIINLISLYQGKHKEKNKGLVIHLNASDERGIDVIRNQISTFVNSKTLLGKGTKFVILDEVDYMTKSAQQALRYLLQCYAESVRFCLICNYICKLDDSLQHEFMRLKFNQLPQKNILSFLRQISEKEGLNISEDSLLFIKRLYGSDMRSMVNFMQTNQDNVGNYKIIHNDIWEGIYTEIGNGANIGTLSSALSTISRDFNVDKKNILKDFLQYIITTRLDEFPLDKITEIEIAIHTPDIGVENAISYVLSVLLS